MHRPIFSTLSVLAKIVVVDLLNGKLVRICRTHVEDRDEMERGAS